MIKGNSNLFNTFGTFLILYTRIPYFNIAITSHVSLHAIYCRNICIVWVVYLKAVWKKVDISNDNIKKFCKVCILFSFKIVVLNFKYKPFNYLK